MPMRGAFGLVLTWVAATAAVAGAAVGVRGYFYFPAVYPPWEGPIEYGRPEFFWSELLIPVTIPLAALGIACLALMWTLRRFATARLWMVAALAFLTVGSIPLPIGFVHFSISGPGVLIVPDWYWPWIVVLCGVCGSWCAYQISRCRRERSHQ